MEGDKSPPTITRTECINDGYVCYIQHNAPSKPGTYNFIVKLESDIYPGFIFNKNFKVIK